MKKTFFFGMMILAGICSAFFTGYDNANSVSSPMSVTHIYLFENSLNLKKN